MSALLGKLEALYGQGDETAAGFRLTDRGIWHATPLAVLAAAVPLVAETGLLVAGGRPARLFDAGAGDGRFLAALALGLPPTFERLLWGLESDATLAATARSKLSTLNHPVRVAEGDFLDPRAYEDLGLRPRDLEVVFNYPDGNERRLLEWLAEHGGPRTRLAILSPDHDPALGTRPESRTPVAHWTLTVFAPASAGRW